MDRVNQIKSNAQYKRYYAEIEKLEADRVFCRHNMEHFLGVARIAWILNEEKHYEIHRELIYAAALLHDIGRHLQYLQGVEHEEASAKLAEPILTECGFTSDEKSQILKAIRAHRSSEAIQEGGLSELIFRADKMSRSCFSCQASAQCHKTKDRNTKIIW